MRNFDTTICKQLSDAVEQHTEHLPLTPLHDCVRGELMVFATIYHAMAKQIASKVRGAKKWDWLYDSVNVEYIVVIHEDLPPIFDYNEVPQHALMFALNEQQQVVVYEWQGDNAKLIA